jgi:hypothetical protein
VQLGGALDQGGDFIAPQAQRDRLQRAQFDLGVFVDDLPQRQHEQARWYEPVSPRQLEICRSSTKARNDSTRWCCRSSRQSGPGARPGAQITSRSMLWPQRLMIRSLPSANR